MAVVTVASCQFPVSADVQTNLRLVTRQMRLAKKRAADVAHFPEGALSGYAGSDFETFEGFDWDGLQHATERASSTSPASSVFEVILGSAHRVQDGHKPHNSLYVITGSGEIVDRYDKRFCSGTPTAGRRIWPTRRGRAPPVHRLTPAARIRRRRAAPHSEAGPRTGGAMGVVQDTIVATGAGYAGTGGPWSP